MSKLKYGLILLVMGAAVTTLVIQHQITLHAEMTRIKADNERASNRVASARAPRLPAPMVKFSAPPVEPAEASGFTNLFAQFPGLKANAHNKLSAAQLESYLQAHGRNATSLLAAFRTTGDPALIKEAMEKYPHDPQVALEAALRKDATPEARRQWLETLKQSDAANSLPNYMSALDYFKTGQTDLAVQELMAASGKHQFEDYSMPQVRETEQAYLAAGYTLAEAMAMSPLQQAMHWSSQEDAVEAFEPFQRQITQLQQVKDLCLNVLDLAKSYRQTGDSVSADAALQMAMNLGQRYGNASDEDGISRLVGSAAEVIALSAMNPNSAYDNRGQTVQDRIKQLRQQRTAIRNLYQEAAPLLGSLAEQDWTSYIDRVRTFGEPAALQWVVGKYGAK